MRITVHHWSSSRSIADCIWVVSTERVQDRLLMGSPGRGDYLPMQRELPQGRWKSCCVVDIPSSGCSCYWSRSGFCQGTESTLAIWSTSSLFWAVLVLPSISQSGCHTCGHFWLSQAALWQFTCHLVYKSKILGLIESLLALMGVSPLWWGRFLYAGKGLERWPRKQSKSSGECFCLYKKVT